MQELQAEVQQLRKSYSELQAAQQALGSKASKAQQQAAALQESRQVPPTHTHLPPATSLCLHRCRHGLPGLH